MKPKEEERKKERKDVHVPFMGLLPVTLGALGYRQTCINRRKKKKKKRRRRGRPDGAVVRRAHTSAYLLL